MPVMIAGLTELYATLDRLTAIETLRRPMYKSVLLVQGKMQVYPPPRPKQKYIRTGTLGRRWTHVVHETATGLEGVIGNNTRYAPRVQGFETQGALFRRRWQTDRDTLEQSLPQIVEFFE